MIEDFLSIAAQLLMHGAARLSMLSIVSLVAAFLAGIAKTTEFVVDGTSSAPESVVENVVLLAFAVYFGKPSPKAFHQRSRAVLQVL